MVERSMSALLRSLSNRVVSLERRIARMNRRPSGPSSGDEALRDATYGIPSNEAEIVALANRSVTWYNTTGGWEESYYAPVGTAGLTAHGLVTGTPAGWYPTGAGPTIQMIPQAPFSATIGAPVRDWGTLGAGRSRRRGGDAWLTYDNATGRIAMHKAGVYRIFAKTTLSAGSGTCVFHLLAGAPSSPDNVFDTYFTLHGTWLTVAAFEQANWLAAAGDICYLYCHSGTLGVHQRSGLPNVYGGEFIVEYVGPALTSL